MSENELTIGDVCILRPDTLARRGYKPMCNEWHRRMCNYPVGDVVEVLQPIRRNDGTMSNTLYRITGEEFGAEGMLVRRDEVIFVPTIRWHLWEYMSDEVTA